MQWRMWKKALKIAFVVIVAWQSAMASPVAADVYVYKDARGIRYFTNVPTKPQYRPFLLLHRYSRSLKEKDALEFDHLIAEACRRYGVEFALVKAVIKAESAFNPTAISRAGARGLMQLMPDTATQHGVADTHDPRSNIEGGVRHLRLLLNRFQGDLTLALAAYNAGPETVDRYSGIPPYEETQNYVHRVLQYRESYRQRGAISAPLLHAALLS